MKKNKEGVWKAAITLPPGRYEYKLFADDEWVENVSGDVEVVGAPVEGRPGLESVPNPFGTQNFVVWV